MKTYCYYCNKDVDYTVAEEYISTVIDNIEIRYFAEIPYCSVCGGEVYVRELDDRNVKRANREYRKMVGLIQVDEIKEILKKYNIGAKPLAKLLGWGEVTILRYLDGLTPSKSYSEILKGLVNPLEMKKWYDKNKDKLSKIAQVKLERSLSELLYRSKDNRHNSAENKLSIFDVANYFLSKVDVESGDVMTHLKLQKLAYYAQVWSLVINGRPLFEGEFQAWRHGPVNPAMYRVYKDFGYNPIPIPSNFDDSIFTEEERNILEMVWDTYGKYNAKYLEKLTHNEMPWEKARKDCGPDDNSNNVISEEDMKIYYSSIDDKEE